MKSIKKKVVQVEELNWDLGIGIWKETEMTYEDAVEIWGDMTFGVREVVIGFNPDTFKTYIKKVIRKTEKGLYGKVETVY